MAAASLHPRSMIDTATVEPLPLYSRDPPPRDSDSISIVSAAPSYRSEAPPYTPPTLPISPCTSQSDAAPQPTGLPNRRYALGFQARPHGSVGDLQMHNYNIASWSSVKTSHASKQYENVAKRRAQRDKSSVSEFAQLLPTVSSGSANPSMSSTNNVPGIVDVVVEQPLNPLEDPQLVGERAAQQAREQRLYRERCLRGDEALRNENKGWDFMMAQMADWEERERSWMRFRESVNGPRRTMLAKRIGMPKLKG